MAIMTRIHNGPDHETAYTIPVMLKDTVIKEPLGRQPPHLNSTIMKVKHKLALVAPQHFAHSAPVHSQYTMHQVTHWFL